MKYILNKPKLIKIVTLIKNTQKQYTQHLFKSNRYTFTSEITKNLNKIYKTMVHRLRASGDKKSDPWEMGNTGGQ